ncbi:MULTISPECIES: cytochrome c [Cyanophyceae]|uniref:c-type cytochrome n=1 Tax=Cyanophyceae TaxID=3028117 RepID=UPI00016DC631|nr:MULTISPECIES: cytochrome c [Cyanophyceae]ACA98385.1 cytochrome cM [Picosynechococcus sp. PCC 7002]AMA08193.1 cytochrome C [Picosynechococcus sp. PCC 73109]ANV86338.1 cytochrome C [Picosynechococcus sp. PCC 7117]ANV89503.1 cytochrome C [Picosynechococcus sp. PCC 8807]QCS49016.1 cytochrome c [Picosynechococcus sp. PCC 11901]
MANSSELSVPNFSKLLFVIILVLAIAALGIFGVYSTQASDPYIQQVLALQGDELRGNAIFQINCAGCHGPQADGNVGPSLRAVAQRKSDVRLIQQVISGKTPPMPKFQPAPQEMADLLSYLRTL